MKPTPHPTEGQSIEQLVRLYITDGIEPVPLADLSKGLLALLAGGLEFWPGAPGVHFPMVGVRTNIMKEASKHGLFFSGTYKELTPVGYATAKRAMKFGHAGPPALYLTLPAARAHEAYQASKSDTPKLDAALARVGVAAPGPAPARPRKRASRIDITIEALKRPEGVTPLELVDLFADAFGRGRGKLTTARQALHKAPGRVGAKAVRQPERRQGFSVYRLGPA